MNNKNKTWKVVHAESSKWARWIALYDAINSIADKAQDKGISFDKLDIKPLAVRDYIEATENIILRKLLKQEYNIDVCYNEDSVTKFEDVIEDN
jgi:hypothetical protein